MSTDRNASMRRQWITLKRGGGGVIDDRPVAQGLMVGKRRSNVRAVMKSGEGWLYSDKSVDRLVPGPFLVWMAR